MLHQHQHHRPNGSTTLPRGFRFHHSEGDEDGNQPQTPEPFNPAGLEDPQSPPRPNRLKVRRRNVSPAIFQAPTEHFLASVAAADVPIPTIEEPRLAPHVSSDCDMPDRDPLSSFLAPHTYNARFASPPRTPVPSVAMEETDSERLDWTMGTSSPNDLKIERPASAASHSSENSLYSEGHLSRYSEDGSCTSPESDCADPFSFPSYSKAKGKKLNGVATESHDTVLNSKLRRKTRKDAPWTSAMTTHLWSIYLLYLQDPVVTPFRIGASAVPPEGVCHRVARQAKKSWKGPKGIHSTKTSNHTSCAESFENGDVATPTERRSRSYTQWPHTSSATRAHLRELCKTKDTSAVQRHMHLQSRNPTPFTQQNARSRYRTPEPQGSMRIPQVATPVSFSTQDVALSLTMSTSETMQPNGPLAQLATTKESAFARPRKSACQPRGWTRSRATNLSLDDSKTRSLGSPFVARTYGPNSTMDGAFDEPRPSAFHVYSDTISGPVPAPRLQSPLHFERPRSIHNKEHKRRVQNHFENLNSGGAILKPNSMNEQIYGIPLSGNQQRRVRTRAFTIGDDLLRNRVPGLFQPLPTGPEKTGLVPEIRPPPVAQPKLLPSATFEPTRLRSPFMEKPSNTFPRRLYPDEKAPVRHSGVVTMHQPRRSIDSSDFGERPSLQSRLSRLDSRLAEIRERENGSQIQDRL
ncbi:hypothetical protein SBOR_0884 [Sclerotinia borealis F-4128]|uniref:Uncharacterized protein n=1 Tax=Sclerotinia borealis (strain F-4128) TaxID=1432307 RepID=W9CS05_SCLBF|nr:hypothetical protein SBOR_0884 [Sclerotinia borealis F-4128]